MIGAVLIPFPGNPVETAAFLEAVQDCVFKGLLDNLLNSNPVLRRSRLNGKPRVSHTPITSSVQPLTVPTVDGSSHLEHP